MIVNFPEPIARLFFLFAGQSMDLFLVGGCVRDHVLGHPCKDYDLATNALPEGIKKILHAAGIATFDTGIKYGTVSAKFPTLPEPVQITTYRGVEKYFPGSRNPEVVFGKYLIDDLRRRDFTINTLAMDADGKLLDHFNGVIDAKLGILRCPIDPETSFSDDPLRMFRCARFAAQLGLQPSEDVLAALKEHASFAFSLSEERIRDEMTKLLMTEKPSIGLTILANSGLLAGMHPKFKELLAFKQNQGKWHSKLVWPHTLDVVDGSPRIPEVRWAALFHDIAKPETYSETSTGVHFYGHDAKGAAIWKDFAAAYRFSNEFSEHVEFLIFEHLQPAMLSNFNANDPSDKVLRRLIHRAGSRLENLFMLSMADITGGKPGGKEKKKNCAALYHRTIALRDEAQIAKLRLPRGLGTQISEELEIEPGKELGAIMKRLNMMLIDGVISANSDFIAIARDIHAKHADA